MLAMLVGQVFNSSRADLARGIYLATFAPRPIESYQYTCRRERSRKVLITFSEGKAYDIVYIHVHLLIRDGK